MFIEKLYEKYGFEAQELEFGPGLPVYYFQNNEFDEEAWANIREMGLAGE